VETFFILGIKLDSKGCLITLYYIMLYYIILYYIILYYIILYVVLAPVLIFLVYISKRTFVIFPAREIKKIELN